MDEAAMTTDSGADAPNLAGFEARCLLRSARQASLATTKDGQPFVTLVTHAVTVAGEIVLLLSDISEHTRHLVADPRCALLATGERDGENPQTAPRVTVTGLAEPIPSEEASEARALFLALHPYAALYADFGDFRFWRIRPMGALLVGGFARARRLRQAELLPDSESVSAIAASSRSILEHCNADHADALVSLAQASGGMGNVWKMVAVDVDGADLASEERSLRINWAKPVQSSEQIRTELVQQLRALRATSG